MNTPGCRLTIVGAIAGHVFGEPMEGIDDWDQVPSFDAGEAPRRSTSSLSVTG
jgi:hypothetical protein